MQEVTNTVHYREVWLQVLDGIPHELPALIDVDLAEVEYPEAVILNIEVPAAGIVYALLNALAIALVLLRVKVEHPCLRAARAESEELTTQQCRRHRHAEPSLSGLLLSSHRADVATRSEAYAVTLQQVVLLGILSISLDAESLYRFPYLQLIILSRMY